MSDDKPQVNPVAMYAVVALLSGGGTHIANSALTTGETGTALDECAVFVEHERRHCRSECELEKLKIK